MRSVIERWSAALRGAYEDLNEREKRLLWILAIALAAFVVVLPFALMQRSLWRLEDENRAIASVLAKMTERKQKLEELAALRHAAQRRYNTKPPPLSTFIADKGREQGIDVREFSDQPDKVVGGYTREHVRVTLPDGVGLAAMTRMMAAIENSGYPVAITRLKVEHFQTGDSYEKVEMDVMSFDRRRNVVASAGEGLK